MTVYKDRVFFTYRNFLYALDKRTGKPIQKFGDDGRIDLRKGLDRPYENRVHQREQPRRDLRRHDHHAEHAVPETLPGAPGHIRAYDANTGETSLDVPYDSASRRVRLRNVASRCVQNFRRRECVGGAKRRPKLGMVFAATGSASFDFYGSNRIGDNLFADCVMALDARTGKRLWHFQGIQHDVWDLRFSRRAQPGHGHSQRAASGSGRADHKTGYVYVLDRRPASRCFRSNIAKFRRRSSTAKSFPKRSHIR